MICSTHLQTRHTCKVRWWAALAAENALNSCLHFKPKPEACRVILNHYILLILICHYVELEISDNLQNNKQCSDMTSVKSI